MTAATPIPRTRVRINTPAPAPVPVARMRTRAVNVDTPADASPRRRVRGRNTPEPTEAQKATATLFYAHNKAANAARSAADKERKKLLASMKEAGLTSFEVDAMDGTQLIRLEVEVATPEQTFIDVALLKDLVTDEQFMEIIEAGKQRVIDKVGTVVATRCEKTRPGTENVNVKPKK